jgi:hypothetical protein
MRLGLRATRLIGLLVRRPLRNVLPLVVVRMRDAESVAPLLRTTRSLVLVPLLSD